MQINLMPDLSLLVVMAIFIAEYFVVKHFFLQPINEVLESRETEARSAQEIYEQALARFQEATSQVEQRLHEAKGEAAKVRDKFRIEASAHRATVVERTMSEATKLVDDAGSRLKRAAAEARDKIVRDSESLARLAAERILGRPI
jgi:F0F1-type ATP synthase membrane subunit b/b'